MVVALVDAADVVAVVVVFCFLWLREWSWRAFWERLG